jgi:hypothetical protein
MPDFSVVSAVISTTGVLLGALGGAGLTHRANVKREEALAKREEAQANRQREDQRTQARRHAYGELLGTATQLRSKIEIAGQRHWKDMTVRLSTIQEHAVSASLHASHVALLSPKTAEAARALGSAAVRLAAATAQHTDMGHHDEGGQINRPLDFTEFDGCLTRFSDAAAQDIAE